MCKKRGRKRRGMLQEWKGFGEINRSEMEKKVCHTKIVSKNAVVLGKVCMKWKMQFVWERKGHLVLT